MNPRIVFMGSPEFAVPTLQKLNDQFQVVGVVTQPDQPAGRGRVLTPPPVKVLAQSNNLPVFQPASLRDEGSVLKLSEWQPDLIVVVAFGQILRKQVLELPAWGCLNVHASLLPRWRGAAPIQAALLMGDKETGVTIMKLDRGVDTGPILAQQTVHIHPDDTAKTLADRLSTTGAELLMATIPAYLQGLIHSVAQDEAGATYAAMITKDQGELDFSHPVDQLERRIRAYSPWPGAYVKFKDNNLKIHQAHIMRDSIITPGQRGIKDGFPAVSALGGWLVLDIVQPAGKKLLSGKQFLMGARDW